MLFVVDKVGFCYVDGGSGVENVNYWLSVLMMLNIGRNILVMIRLMMLFRNMIIIGLMVVVRFLMVLFILWL